MNPSIFRLTGGRFSVRRLAPLAAPALLCVAALLAGCWSHEPPPGSISAPGAEPADPADEAYGGEPRPPFDPVAVNGPIFVDWPAPDFVLLLTGEQQGYLEPCGCAGLENQKGGLRRRHTLLKELAARGWPLLAVDNGGLIRRYGRQAELQYQTSAEALREMGYACVGFGVDDLRLPAATLLGLCATAPDLPSPFVSANVGILGFDPETIRQFSVVEVAGRKVGLTTVLGDSLREQITNDEIEFRPAEEALQEILPQLAAADCQTIVVLCHGEPEETRALASSFPQIDVILSARGADEPPHEAESLPDTGALFVEVGRKGMYAVALGFYEQGGTKVRYQRVPLDSRFADSPEMVRLFTTYQDQLQEAGWEGLEVRPVAHPRADAAHEALGRFAGSAACAKCHKTAHGIWSKTGHAHATESLVKLDPQRQFDPECVSCHVTGWNPQEYFPYQSGYDSIESTPLLVGNGCENCHGPAQAHVEAEAGRDRLFREEQRQALRLTAATAGVQVCVRCHDHDNSPAFEFEKYWLKIVHKGKD